MHFEIKICRSSLSDPLTFFFFLWNRKRLKIFNEALSVFNKFFPSVPSKKRSRLEVYNNDRSNFILSGERSARGQVGKFGNQSHAVTGVFEHEMQKPEERIKNAMPNKRTRTSLVDARGVCTLFLLHNYVLLRLLIQCFDPFSFCICTFYMVDPLYSCQIGLPFYICQISLTPIYFLSKSYVILQCRLFTSRFFTMLFRCCSFLEFVLRFM